MAFKTTSISGLVLGLQLMLLLLLAVEYQLAAADGNGGEDSSPCSVLKYYLQQQFSVNELSMVPAARAPVNGTATGFGLEVVYEFVMTNTSDPSSDVMGYVRGTAIVVNNTVPANVFFVSNVVHYEYAGLNGTLSQQGEAVFNRPPWEFSVMGGTGDFRNAFGYNVGTFFSATPTPNGTHIVNYYEAHLCYRRCRRC